MATTGRFFYIPYPISKEHVPHLLGRFVADPENPLRDFCPKQGRNPSDIIPNINPKPVSIAPHQLASASSDASVSAKLRGLASIGASSEGESAISVQGEDIQCYSMIQVPDAFDALMADKQCRAEVEKMLKNSEHGACYLITGFMAVSGKTEWVKLVWGAQELQVIGTIPLQEAGTGAPDIGLDARTSRSAYREARGNVVEDQTVFALAYDVVVRKRGLKRRAGKLAWFLENTIKLDKERRARWNHVAMGGSGPGGDDADDDDEDEDDDDDDDDDDDLAPLGRMVIGDDGIMLPASSY
ncbi:hypothetical protein BDN72DRAFT_841292 [Pluteus cervinus]|uniref:Uncharacterized protein n=1 Tax=Pluteus cervinus TaxID=181527 RepID=A0ACD3AU24_9AGAR|nr:hypothetical protein BDN72DRAFT_841292 [Pluteus cervinus]